MSVKTREQLFDDLVEILQPDDLRWLGEQLLRLSDDEPQPESNLWDDDDDDEPLPESATLEEAVQLYLDDKCSLGQAAELAGVTRWHVIEVLYKRRIPTNGNHKLMEDEIKWMLDIIREVPMVPQHTNLDD